MSKKFAQAVLDAIHEGSSDPIDQIQRVKALCAGEGVSKPTALQPPPPPPRPAPPVVPDAA